MIKTALDTSAPFIAGSGILGMPVLATAGINGITESELGKTLLVVMAFAVIANQLWQIGERIVRTVKGTPQDLTGLAGLEVCEQRHLKIDADLVALRADNARQDRIGTEHFQTITQSLVELRHEISAEFDKVEQKVERQTTGLHKRNDDILRAVSRLEGKVNQ